MTEACFLSRGAYPLRKPTTCEECIVRESCKMYGNFKQLEVTASGYAKLLGVKP
jgi:hypothetical protein